MDKQDIAAAFESKILGIRNYKSDKKEFVVSDLLDTDVLRDFLDEVSTGESDITPAGKVFLNKYFGFKELASRISCNGNFALREHPATAEEISKWLEELKPMETMTFIEEARGNIQPGAAVRSDLLPPDNI